MEEAYKIPNSNHLCTLENIREYKLMEEHQREQPMEVKWDDGDL